jgi:hypothetical protein
MGEAMAILSSIGAGSAKALQGVDLSLGQGQRAG